MIASDPLTLNRWLDRTPIDRLTRQRGYITLPSLEVPNTDAVYGTYPEMIRLWRFNNFNPTGYTEIDHNLSLDLDSVADVFGEEDVLWCVAYLDEVLTNVGTLVAELPLYSIVRYALNKTQLDAAGVAYGLNVEQYTGQLLPAYALRLEVWKSDFAGLPVYGYTFDGGQLLTTVLSNVDTRSGSTFNLGQPNVLESNFEADNGLGVDNFTLPFEYTAGTLEFVQYSGLPNSNFP